MTYPELPLTVEEITPEWLTGALSVSVPGAEVEGAEVDSVIWGTATKAFVEVRYAPGAPESAPGRVCVKGGFDATMRQVMSVGYQVEASFYRDLASKLPEGLPTSYFADANPDSGQGVVVMNDLKAEGGTFFAAGDRLSLDQVVDGLTTQATWHSATDIDAEWLAPPTNLRAVADAVLTPENWARQLGSEPSETVRSALSDRDRYLQGLRRTWELEDAVAGCLTHGDANITNVYLSADGKLHFVDWQFVSKSHWAHDVAFFLICGLSVEDRREHEQDLLREYLKLRSGRGGEAPSWDEAWRDYRIHTLHGLMYALTPNEMQPAEVRAPLSERFAQALLDHDSYGLLGV